MHGVSADSRIFPATADDDAMLRWAAAVTAKPSNTNDRNPRMRNAEGSSYTFIRSALAMASFQGLSAELTITPWIENGSPANEAAAPSADSAS